MFLLKTLYQKTKGVEGILGQCINWPPNPYFAGPIGNDCTRAPWSLGMDKSGALRQKKRTLKLFVVHSFIFDV